MRVSNQLLNLEWSIKLNIQTQMRFNHATLEIALVEFLLKENRIEKAKALKTLNKTFDTLVDIRDANPDDPIQDYVERVFDRIAELTH